MTNAKEIAMVLDGVARGLLGRLQSALDIGGLGDFFFFRAILRFLRERINEFGFDLMERMMAFIGFMALSVLSIWVFWQGYRVLTGQMRESLMGLMANMVRAVFIVALAVTFGTVGSATHRYLTEDMKDGIHHLVTGSNSTPEEKIDESLGWLQVAMSTMDSLDLQGDPALVSEKERASFYVGLGTGGPAVVAGSMLLLYQIALALFIGLGPLFILCLLFDSTKALFQRWLFYGIGTMFSMAVLSFMVSLALDMVTRVAGAMWISAAAGQLLLGENVVGGLNSVALQQGGMGLILTTLILMAPPMAAMFFQGTLGQFTAYATMGAHLAPGQGQPQRGVYSEGGPASGWYQPTMPSQRQVGGEGRSDDVGTRSGDFQAAQATRTPLYSTSPGGAAAGSLHPQSGLGPGMRGAVNMQEQNPLPYTPPPTGAHAAHQNVPRPAPVTSSSSAQTRGPTNTPPPRDETPRRD